jgi:branched-chain amino acid transport system permease protein
MTRRHIALVAAWTLVAATFIVLPYIVGNYYIYVGQRLLIVATLALGLNLFQGYCGQAHFGISGLAVFGAYGSGLIETKMGVHPFLTIIPAVAIGGVVAYLLSFVVLRLRHMSQALGTVAFALTVYSLLQTAVPRDWGGGDEGFSLPAIEVFNTRLDYRSTYFVLFVLLVVVVIVCALVVRSSVGRAWMAIRGDETAAAVSGVDVKKFMRIAFVLTGCIAALGGVMMAMQSRYIAPDNFDLFSNIFILLIVVIGGQGSNTGMLVGALVLIAIGEYIAEMQDFPTLIYGLILFAVMRFLPRGLWPHVRDGARSIAVRVSGGDGGGPPLVATPDVTPERELVAVEPR